MISYKNDKWVIAAGLTAMMLGVTTAFCVGAKPAKAEEKTLLPKTTDRGNLVRTARVHPDDLDWEAKMGIGYDGSAGQAICRTKLREYCVEEGDCDWYVDFYVVKSPRVCPVEPIE